jgi:hypothetical protein
MIFNIFDVTNIENQSNNNNTSSTSNDDDDYNDYHNDNEIVDDYSIEKEVDINDSYLYTLFNITSRDILFMNSIKKFIYDYTIYHSCHYLYISEDNLNSENTTKSNKLYTIGMPILLLSPQSPSLLQSIKEENNYDDDDDHDKEDEYEKISEIITTKNWKLHYLLIRNTFDIICFFNEHEDIIHKSIFKLFIEYYETDEYNDDDYNDKKGENEYTTINE